LTDRDITPLVVYLQLVIYMYINSKHLGSQVST